MRSIRKIVHITIISAFIIISILSKYYLPGREFKTYSVFVPEESDQERIAGILSLDALMYGISYEFEMVQTITDCMYLDIDGDYSVLAFVVLSIFFLSQFLTDRINKRLNSDIHGKERILVCIDMYCIENIILYITLTAAYPAGNFLRLKINSMVNDDFSIFVFTLFMAATVWLMIVLFLFVLLPYACLGGLPLAVLNIFNNVFGMCIIILLEVVTIGLIWHSISGHLINKSFSCIFYPIHVIRWLFQKINSLWKWW